jgi:hypothetical protein
MVIYPNKNNNYTYEDSIMGISTLYTYDTIKSFKETYNDSIEKKDGWLGFTNISTLYKDVNKDCNNILSDSFLNGDFNGGNNDIIFTGNNNTNIVTPRSVTESYYINKCINNIESCQFVDMAPERDLFYFTPKKNNYRKRLEYNWEYFITYPFKSIYDDGIILKGKNQGLPLSDFSILGSNNKKYIEYTAPNGTLLAMFRSPIKHNLKAGDYIYLKFSEGENVKCRIISVGSFEKKYNDRYFSIRKDDFDDSIISESSTPERFSKSVSGYECQYYFRKFKKIDKDLSSTLNKLAFANTIHGDDVNQIIFTDTLDITNYKDNLGRPLSEIYLTILKTNKGYKKWYDSNIFNTEDIEYSHVFGKITSGLDLPSYSGKKYPVLRQQHNVKPEDYKDITIPSSSLFLEEDITKENTDEFFGDLVEFNPTTLNETTLEEVKHRFNTAQRETNNELYNKIYYDEIYSDSYDYGVYGTNKLSSGSTISQNILNKGYANIGLEGYIYKPHHKVQIKEYSNIVKQSNDTLMEVHDINFNDNMLSFISDKNYNLVYGDIITLIDKKTLESVNFEVKIYYFDNKSYKCVAQVMDNIENISKDVLLFKKILESPEYAYLIPDGSGRRIWKGIVEPSDYTFTSPLYNIPYTNNAFYHHTNIIFPVKRQDPFGDYGLDIDSVENNFKITSEKLDISFDEFIPKSDYSTCF